MRDSSRLGPSRSEEHTSELQSRLHIVCRLLLEKKKMYGFLAIVFAMLVVDQGWNLVLAIAVTIVFGVVIGFVNGFFTTQFRIPSFIVTLGMLGVLRGAALVLSGGLPVGTLTDKTFNTVSAGLFFGGVVPAQVFWLAGVMIVAAILGMISNGLILVGVDQYYQQLVTGTIIVAAALLNVTVRRATASEET